MRLPDFENLRAGRSDCPSDLALDRLVTGELEAAARQETETHVASCEACAERIATLRAGFDAIDDVDPRRLLAGVRRRLDEEPAPRGWGARVARWLREQRRVWAPLTAAALAAALLVVVLPRTEPGPDPEPGPGSDVVRRKGGLALHVFRMTEGGSEEMVSGDRFRAGDRIRFVVDVPAEGHVAVVGVEADGDLYVAWPLAADAGDTLRPAGKRQALPGAVALDATPGRETLYVVHCPVAAGTAPVGSAQGGPPTCTSRGADAPPACPDGCALSPFVVTKEP